jgi:hypothetical protein
MVRTLVRTEAAVYSSCQLIAPEPPVVKANSERSPRILAIEDQGFAWVVVGTDVMKTTIKVLALPAGSFLVANGLGCSEAAATSNAASLVQRGGYGCGASTTRKP